MSGVLRLPEQHECAEDLFGRLEAGAVEALSPVESSALLKSLLFPVHDLDHPDMEQDEWAAAEAMRAALSAQRGR